MQHMELQHNALSLCLFKPLAQSLELQALKQKIGELEKSLNHTQQALLEQTALAEGYACDLEHMISLIPPPA